MKLLVTFPGKHGDSLWALPTLRALAEANGGHVDLLMAPAYSGILPLYRAQAYIGRADAWPSWQVQNTAPMTPWSPFEETLHHEALGVSAGYEAILHLGYREWPTAPMHQYVYSIAQREYPTVPIAPLDLDRPWITLLLPRPGSLIIGPDAAAWPPMDIVSGWADEHFELKYGVESLALRNLNRGRQTYRTIRRVSAPKSRWVAEGDDPAYSWEAAAFALLQAKVFFGCCSALHVLACAMGKRLVMMEPAEARWNPIFWPYGQDGPRVMLVKGNDGRPTWDARHCADALRGALEAAHARR